MSSLFPLSLHLIFLFTLPPYTHLSPWLLPPTHLLPLTLSPYSPPPLFLLMIFHLVSFLAYILSVDFFSFFIPSFFRWFFYLFLSVVTILSPLPVSWQLIDHFLCLLSTDSFWFMCPSSKLPEGHQGKAQKTQAVKDLFLLSLQSFSLLSSLTCVSFFSPHFTVILSWMLWQFSLTIPFTIHHSLPYFVPFPVCISFSSLSTSLCLILVVLSISSPAVLQSALITYQDYLM